MNFLIYIIKRTLAIIPTLLGISLISFFLINLAPGGPVEQALQKIRFSQGSNISSSASGASQSVVSDEVIESLKKQFGWDKPVHIRYFLWLKKMLVLDFGESFVHYRPVTTVIVEKFPVSLFFGIVSFFLTYLICLPLGIFKAIRHKSIFDTMSSIIVFIAYSIPSFVIAIVLISFLGPAGLDLFPIGGLHSELYEMKDFWGKVWDRCYHMVLPLFCYMLGSFAVLTMLMKNSMLEEVQKDYVRTARAKGLEENTVIFKHVLRNALLPIAVGFGSILSIFFAGSLLLETIFNLDGIGLLGYQAVLQRDVNVIMGLLVIQSFLALMGILLSDITLALIDPRIDFSKKRGS